MSDLKTNYKNSILDTSTNTKQKFKMIQNDDGTVSFEDVTDYSQAGDDFGAADINATNAAVNSNVNAISELNTHLTENDSKISTNKTDISSLSSRFGHNFGAKYDFSGADINNLRANGFCSGNNLSNAPTNGWFTWINLNQNGNDSYCHQIGFVIGKDTLYIRTYAYGKWSSWRSL